VELEAEGGSVLETGVWNYEARSVLWSDVTSGYYVTHMVGIPFSKIAVYRHARNCANL